MQKQICKVCGKEVKNLNFHMRKYHTSAHGEDTKPELVQPIVEYATKEDLQKITEALVEITKSLNDLKNPYGNKPEPTPAIAPTTGPMDAITPNTKENEPEVNVPKEEVSNPDKMPVPPAWRKMVDETLGLDFGIDLVYPQSGSGFLFKIIVPPEKSNASAAHKEFYKVDIRTKAISYADGVEGIRKFCELVATNLKRKG